jgi:hypothetical protein
VYGNYINGKSGRGQSGGIRIVNPNQTVFNNLIDNIEGTSTLLKAPLVIMSGFKGAQVNEYTPADHAIVAFNIIRNSIGPAVKIGVCNTGKGRECQVPIDVQLSGNVVVNVDDDLSEVLHIEDPASEVKTKNNYYSGSMTLSDTVFARIQEHDVWNLFLDSQKTENKFDNIFNSIKRRAETLSIKLETSDITQFNADKIPSRKDVGVSWLQD